MVDDRCARVRETFLAAGFTVDSLLSALGGPAYAALARGDTTPARLALVDRSDGLALLTRLFVTGQSVTAAEAVRELPLDDLAELGLVGPGRDGIRSLLDVRPYGEPDTDWYAVSDLGPGTGGRADSEVAGDHVLGIGGASLTLAQLVPRAPVGSALDVGTGCGVQALHLSRHSHQVTATDTSARALRLAALTAGLSGQRWDLREGSLLDPVAGQTYDLVVSNPPFVISPGRRYTYRDSGLTGDDLGRTLVQGLPTVLAEGGTAVVLANWLHVRGQDWRDRVAGWVEGTGCEAWVAQRDVQDPTEYVGLWLRDVGTPDGPEHEARYAEWLAALAEVDAEAVGFGWIVLRRTGTTLDPRIEDVSGALRLPNGDQVAALFAVRDQLATTDALALLAARPRLAPGLELLEVHRAGADSRFVRQEPVLRLVGGWRSPIAMDPVGAAVLRECDGEHTVAEAFDLVAAAHHLDPDDVRAGGLGAVRALLESAHLTL